MWKRVADFSMGTMRICVPGRSLWRRRNFDREFTVRGLWWMKGKARRLFLRTTFAHTLEWLTSFIGFITMLARLRLRAVCRKIRPRLRGVELFSQVSGSM